MYIFQAGRDLSNRPVEIYDCVIDKFVLWFYTDPQFFTITDSENICIKNSPKIAEISATKT